MAITIKTQGKIEKGRLVLDDETNLFPQDCDVEVVVIVKEKTAQSFAEIDSDIQKSFEEAGIHTREQILDLIRDVKRERFQEKFGEKFN